MRLDRSDVTATSHLKGASFAFPQTPTLFTQCFHGFSQSFSEYTRTVPELRHDRFWHILSNLLYTNRPISPMQRQYKHRNKNLVLGRINE